MAMFINPEDLVVDTFEVEPALNEALVQGLVTPVDDTQSNGLNKCCTGEASGCYT